MATIFIQIARPEAGLECFSIQTNRTNRIVFFPDGGAKKDTDFPLTGITFYFKEKGHIIVANAHRERWIFPETTV